ncbi:Peroxide stress-activated histidine kinase mak1 [Madurella fahalii]|uniref:histidine kinase n=1 Tax=Madurella fahalii TaxID=1157608 RepID=A0ABQ0G1T0_9PEZI
MHPSIVDTSIIDLLEADPRPSFIVALAPHPPTVVYTNQAFAGYPALLDLITAKGDDSATLWEWITGIASAASPEAPATGGRTACSSFSYSNVYWTRSVVHEQMVVVGANEQSPSSELPRKVRLDVAEPRSSSVSPPRRIIPIDSDMTSVAAELSSPAPPSPVSDRRIKSFPATLPINLRERPPSRADAVQSLESIGRSVSDPGWILPDIKPELRPFLDVINSVDWEATPLGSMRTWSPRLEETVQQILVDSRPIAVYWGPSYTTIYNEAFSKLCGAKHPAMLGMPVQEAWSEAGQRLKDTMGSISPNQMGSVEDEWRFFVENEPEVDGGSPWLEETYLKWSIIPIVENNECVGFMHPVAETTSLRLWERRMKMLIDLGEILVTARDVESYWEKAIQQLAAVEPRYDIPLAILYTVEDDPDAMATAPPHGPAQICRLAGSLGVPENHPIAPESLNLRTSDEPLSLLFREAMGAQHPLLIQTSDGTLPQTLLEGLQWRGFEGDPCRAAVICPIRPTKEEGVMGLLLLGLNPRRPYDNDYRQYISLLSQKMATSLASIVLLEEEARRGRNAAEQAAYDQAMLQEKLAVQTKEANESIQMFEAVAEFVPVGMCFGDPEGNLTYANDAWYKITGFPGTGPITKQSFLSCAKEEDRPHIAAAYETLNMNAERNVQFEFRVKSRASPDGSPSLTRNSPSFEKAGLDLVSVGGLEERYVLATARAECAADGSVLRVLTCLTDVTAHKRAAEEAVRRAQQAENLKRMAEYATVGLYDMDLDGRLLRANTVFFEMCGLQKVDPAEVDIRPWHTCVRKDDIPLITDKLEKMVREDKVQTVEFRLNTTWTADDGSGHTVVLPRWVQATMMPVRTADGVIQSFTGCLSDVSLQKWQLDWEKARKEEAIESKRQHENFIDMTSHEMRNPLSAIIHCADAITATLTRVQQLLGHGVYGDGANVSGKDLGGSAPSANPDDDWRSEVRGLVESGIENAETIVSCAQHQKRIVDDILTMSKLDSNLLAITPITVDPIQMVREALKMFEVEARRVDINLSMVVDPAYRELGIKYLDFDPSRLKQVLINLLTNALKFTNSGPTRNVSVGINASLTRPTEATSKVQFIPRSAESYDYDQPAHPNRDKPVFLMFEVKDTGQGLTDEEKKSLFQRFVQASSRTHVKYGGSGLGLFISRRLTELQNGAIGVASQPGVGSTFAFYIEAYVPSDAALREAEAHAAAAGETLLGLRATTPGADGGHKGATKRDSSSGPLNEAISAASSSSGLGSAVVTRGDTPISSEISVSPTAASAPKIKGVLVVEDNLINQQITRRGLINMGFTVDVANHGVECLEKLQRTDRYVQPVCFEKEEDGAAAAAAARAPSVSIIDDSNGH